jgi:predicted acylesterase/phospholipase RssA
MCATRTDRQEAVLFRSYLVPEEDYTASAPYLEPTLDIGFDDISIGDAARVTSSAPTYLEPKIVHDVKFWDGGMLNNNPIYQVWDARDDVGRPVACVLSLGCSYPSKTVYGIFPLINILTRATSYITNTESKHRDFERMIRRANVKLKQSEKIQYFRLNVPTGNESLNLDDWKKCRD